MLVIGENEAVVPVLESIAVNHLPRRIHRRHVVSDRTGITNASTREEMPYGERRTERRRVEPLIDPTVTVTEPTHSGPLRACCRYTSANDAVQREQVNVDRLDRHARRHAVVLGGVGIGE